MSAEYFRKFMSVSKGIFGTSTGAACCAESAGMRRPGSVTIVRKARVTAAAMKAIRFTL